MSAFDNAGGAGIVAETRPAYASASPTPTGSAQPSAANTILIWWPSALYPGDDSRAASLLRDQLAAFQSTQNQSITVQLRVKRADGVGGILQTLGSASVAAPSVVPSMTLIRRSELVAAVAAKLVEPIDMRTFSAGDIFPSAMSIGQVRGVQYGIPYALQVLHTVYRPSVLPVQPQSLGDVATAGQAYLFPAGVNPGSVNITMLAQYMAAGGRLVNDKGAPVLDREPLLAVLRYYEHAVTVKLAGPSLLDYNNPLQYWPLFLNGKANLVVMDSSTLLARHGGAETIGILPLLAPNRGSVPISAVDGWLWVLTTADLDKQARALGLLAWLMQADQQGSLLRELNSIPSRRSALEIWATTASTGSMGGADSTLSTTPTAPPDGYSAFIQRLLEQPAIPPLDTVPPPVATALQKAFEDVLSVRVSSEAAADGAVAAVAAASAGK